MQFIREDVGLCHFLSYFEKYSSYVGGLSVCMCVAVYVYVLQGDGPTMEVL